MTSLTVEVPLLKLAEARPLLPATAALTSMFTPRTTVLFLIVTVPRTVGRVPFIEGRAIVLEGGVMPNNVSKSAAIAPWPINPCVLCKLTTSFSAAVVAAVVE